MVALTREPDGLALVADNSSVALSLVPREALLTAGPEIPSVLTPSIESFNIWGSDQGATLALAVINVATDLSCKVRYKIEAVSDDKLVATSSWDSADQLSPHAQTLLVTDPAMRGIPLDAYFRWEYDGRFAQAWTKFNGVFELPEYGGSPTSESG